MPLSILCTYKRDCWVSQSPRCAAESWQELCIQDTEWGGVMTKVFLAVPLRMVPLLIVAFTSAQCLRLFPEMQQTGQGMPSVL